MHKKLAATGVALLLGLGTPGALFAQTSGTGSAPAPASKPQKPITLIKPHRDPGAKPQRQHGPKRVQVRVKPPHLLPRVKPQHNTPARQKPVRATQTKPQRQQQQQKQTQQSP
jgi:hypothetical protein